MSTAISFLKDITPEVVFTEDGADRIIAEVRRQALAFAPDVSTEAGRKEIASMAYGVARSKTVVDEVGKQVVVEWKRKASKIDAIRKRIRDELDCLKLEVRRPLTDWENAEKDRVNKLEKLLSEIEVQGIDLEGLGSDQLVVRLAALENLVVDEAFQEYQEQAQLARYKSMELVRRAYDKAVVDEKVEAERIKSERKRAEQEQKDRGEAIRKEAEAKAKAEAEQKAEQERKQQQEELQRAKEAEAKAKADAEKARQDERDRIEAEAKARKALQDKREADDEYRRVVISAASASLCEKISLNQDVAMAIVKAIADGEIKHLKVEF